MKNIKFIVLLISASFLMASSCTKEDDAFYNSAYVIVPDLITIETQTTYSIGSILWINSNNFSRYINEPNQSTLLDVRKTTNSNIFYFVYSLEKRDVNGDWQKVNVSNQFATMAGSATAGNFVLAQAIYNASSETYDFKGGITLLETGQYRIIFGESFSQGNNFDLTSDNAISTTTYLTIATTAINTNGGTYTFNVQ